MELKTCLCISAYGNSQKCWIISSLESIYQNVPNIKVILLYSDIDDVFINALGRAYSNVIVINYSISTPLENLKRISSKTIFWLKAYNEAAIRGFHNIILIDTDVIVTKDLSDAFVEYAFDVGITHKPYDIWPINTGVIFVKNSEKALLFLQAWNDMTEHIVSDKTLFDISNSIDHPYGAADQMAAFNLLNYNKSYHNTKSDFNSILLPCNIYNQTQSVEMHESIYCYHYKSGWRGILAGNENYSLNRMPLASIEMHIYFLRIFINGLERLNLFAGTNLIPEDLGIVIPWYIDAQNYRYKKYVIILMEILLRLKRYMLSFNLVRKVAVQYK